MQKARLGFPGRAFLRRDYFSSAGTFLRLVNT